MAAAFVFCLVAQHDAKAQTIKVSEDSYVWATNPTTNYGSGVEAAARDTVSTTGRISYFKFPLTSLTGKQVATAKIKFFVYLPSSTAVTEILQIHKMPVMFDAMPNTWTENDVTFDTRPNVTPTPIGEITVNSVAVSTPNNYSNSYELDIASYLNDALAAGQSDISIAIKAKPKKDGGKDKQVRLGTKEAGTGGEFGASITYSGAVLGNTDFKTNQPSANVYPNPIESAFTLSRTFSSSDVVEVAIYNVLGAKVAGFKENVGAGSWIKDLNAKELNMNKGVYLINISSQSNGNATSKVVVK